MMTETFFQKNAVPLLAVLVVGMTVATAVAAHAQLPLLEDNTLVYAHHHLNVTNIAEVKKFWVDTLGGTAVTAGPLQMVKFPDVIIVFTQRAPTGGSKGTVVNHIGFSVPSVRKSSSIAFRPASRGGRSTFFETSIRHSSSASCSRSIHRPWRSCFPTCVPSKPP